MAALAISATMASCGTSGPNEQLAIARTIRATLADYIQRDSTAFCADFTPAVAAHLTPGRDCEAGMAAAFASQRYTAESYASAELPSGLHITDVSRQGRQGSALTAWPWLNPDRKVRLTLEKHAGRWRISTPTKLVFQRHCSKLFGERVCLHSISVVFSA